MDVEKYKALIDRIILEKGISAIPVLLNLLEDENEEVRDIVIETIYRFGDQAKPVLLEKFKERMHKNEKNDVITLYIADILADLNEQSIKKDLYNLLQRYDDEMAHLVIYEALAKLGEGEKVVDVVGYFLIEDEYRQELAEQAIMVLANIPTKKALDYLIKAYKMEEFSNVVKQDIVKATAMLIIKNPELWDELNYLGDSKLIDDVKRMLG
ncbi:HEAT repeat domain-containing protein [Pseudothermotoga thermarum]|uniref:HEAT domain containing protein n=1 Tax=Pseudothermotoga thermarum DSM 5069 TaxID=688269 RepID=F7YX53_9THEM|nr:HEAT repeat domain-containing protein [Pseudothermotoga thermarum]AEH50889.1 HEAT domain containing protein [Pseudothermotoga thermarum DSM 5069]